MYVSHDADSPEKQPLHEKDPSPNPPPGPLPEAERGSKDGSLEFSR
jgi:hypothetical protein